MERIDRDSSNGLSVEEMVHWMVRMERAQTKSGLRNQFRENDRNSDGYVTLTEFARSVSTSGKRGSSLQQKKTIIV